MAVKGGKDTAGRARPAFGLGMEHALYSTYPGYWQLRPRLLIRAALPMMSPKRRAGRATQTAEAVVLLMAGRACAP